MKVSLCIETVAHLPHVYVVRILPPKARSTSETKGEEEAEPVGNCIQISLQGTPILSKRKGLWEVIFS